MSLSHAVRIPSSLFSLAQKHGKIQNRTVPKQLEHWIAIGRLAEENTDLSYSLLVDTLLAIEEVKNGETSEYTFDS